MKQARESAPVEILLVEDNPGDVRLTREILREAKIHNTLTAIGDGEEALKYLHRQDKYAEASRPDLILLDLNLPKKNGHEVLREIKTATTLKRIPVVILTTSQAEKDIMESYDGNANAYVTKPLDPDRFISILQDITKFWLEIVKLPPGSKAETVGEVHEITS